MQILWHAQPRPKAIRLALALEDARRKMEQQVALQQVRLPAEQRLQLEEDAAEVEEEVNSRIGVYSGPALKIP